MKTAIFLLLDNYADWEGAYLSSQLNQKDDWQIRTASTQKEVISMGGFRTTIDYLLAELPKPKTIDLLVLVGGKSWEIENQQLFDYISACLQNRVVVGAICDAVSYLAKNGLLNNVQHTGNALAFWKDFQGYHNSKDFIEKQAVKCENLITANGTAPLEFTQLVLEAVDVSSEEAEQFFNIYKLGFYAFSQKFGSPF
ncbi:type 1 glutamine amidotransferase family protein [Acinetobacter puyangensis]|uniref:DJ-1/PfpI family protein n=1 Tax=Acinetobacter puyangensis TaxID=1096779 RepID=A0A240EB19_9GAMM|nr:type 1 glutamine amidotransferase family protein [Acinetobacter puyangensis]SNX45898.1 DJ-1/PfpI family protein [Acinetobacter puyangensis]